MKILISAAEASSDIHGALLLRALEEQAPADVKIEAFGVGGPRLQAAGLRTLVDTRELLSMGFVEVLSRLPRILRAIRKVADTALAEKPDVVVVMDYPDFHFRLAKRLKPSGIPLIYYIPPKVWAWRKGRVHVMRALFTKILCILPFEEEFYRTANLPVSYVGNPLVDELPMKLTQEEARRTLGLPMGEPVLVLMPGSRPAELKFHLEIMLNAAEKLAENLGRRKLICLMPLPEITDTAPIEERIAEWRKKRGPSQIDLRLSRGNSDVVMKAGTVGMIKSGTSTLEAALLDLPHVIMYNGTWISGLIFYHIVRYRGPIGLVNLVAGCKEGDRFIANEYLGEFASPEVLAREAQELIQNSERRIWVLSKLKEIQDKLSIPGGETSPSARAAREVLKVAGCLP